MSRKLTQIKLDILQAGQVLHRGVPHPCCFLGLSPLAVLQPSNVLTSRLVTVYLLILRYQNPNLIIARCYSRIENGNIHALCKMYITKSKECFLYLGVYLPSPTTSYLIQICLSTYINVGQPNTRMVVRPIFSS